MPRPRSGFYNTIEYIGPRPQKPKRRNFFGGWVIIAIAVGMGAWYGKPLIPFLQAANVDATQEQAAALISELGESDRFGNGLAAAALAHSGDRVAYDRAYFKIAYPNGDVPSGKGVAADVLIRCYRRMGIDLQQLVHEDMTANFRVYPQLWDAPGPDSNIDHRRVPNLQKFFERNGQTLEDPQTFKASRDAKDYRPGDIVVWALNNTDHIGIVVPGPGKRADEAWIVHNIGGGVKWENILFDYPIERHFRYPDSGKDDAVRK